MVALLDRLDRLPMTSPVLPLAVASVSSVVANPEPPSVEERMNAALGCRTSEVALALTAQIVKLRHPTLDASSSEQEVQRVLLSVTAHMGELDPQTGMEALLAVQMVGAQHAAMEFLSRSLLPNQSSAVTDANVLRATRLMRLFNEQLEAMSKLKGKSGQQRVVVEHVTVNEGGQAIEGTVARGGGGAYGDEPR